MNYTLVVQFALNNASASDFDRLLMIENELQLALRENHQVSGHDIGSAALNIFIQTDESDEALALVKDTLAEKDLQAALIAVTDSSEASYSVIWPQDYTGEFII